MTNCNACRATLHAPSMALTAHANRTLITVLTGGSKSLTADGDFFTVSTV